ncbi:MAG: DoxX family protein [Maricaulaceae bacterium]
MTNTILMGVGRTLLGIYFLLPGVMKFAAWDMHVASMAATDIPSPELMLPIAGAAQIIAGILLILGSYVRISALGCAVLVIVINLMMHDFWNMDELRAPRETQNFVKNLGIFAGLLVLASVSKPRAISVKGFWKRDSKVID